MGKMGMARSWTVFSRPRKTLYLVLSLILVYGLVVSWRNAWSLALVLRKTDIVTDGRVIGVVLRLSGVEIKQLGEEGFDENQLPFDDVNITQRKSDDEIRREFDTEFEETGKHPGAGKFYGGTLSNLAAPANAKKTKIAVKLTKWKTAPSFSTERPFKMDPYPNYNSWSWRRSGKARYVPCKGPLGRSVADVSAFVGLPDGFPSPSIGSYDVFAIDQHLCYERDTRLGIYALADGTRDEIDWGDVQMDCVDRNQARFDLVGPPNDLVTTVYGEIPAVDTGVSTERHKLRRRTPTVDALDEETNNENGQRRSLTEAVHEQRTAILLRSYTGKKYTENDRYIIRALVAELSLRSGGEYQVFLLVHVKDEGVNLWDNQTYETYLQESVPKEFLGMTLLWNDDFVQETYPKLEKGYEASVHNAQWLSVQKFMQEFREFAFVWNWEMDARITGHAYDMLEKLGQFSKRQPRRGLWERNERYYIPGYHGVYDTDFRLSVEAMSKKSAVWGPPPDTPFINPIGPRPPTTAPHDDKFKWGVGEDADLITLSPLFDPKGSGWVLGDQVWSYDDVNHTSESLPRRGAIVTQCRLSRRLLDIMHVENLRGNHVGSEMAPGTVALLHGLKAVYAPMPIFMDRPWAPERLARWFNNGPRGGSSGGPDSAMGWGREGRFRGSTWYYRADPPQRLYSNWVGYEDNGVGGLEWEMAHGRPCLPAMFLHPVKDVVPTSPGYGSESRLPY
ncbi:hypothetical protein SPBR_05675 [Sporothrix brasiliensis 5110]|uniref:Major facilitator superfamily transporter n=1 Tax=Sporothrix brasiliensis 5110 TaxID=1398154 RepID=A0A0C2IYQ4_9PEZI|nr:uncharacterized protein SPBR_05675 [Sporothrix brasiliensis 5110]KIH94216.1 hypothetical protein SPBR_05675 [Sporothrix brasiliensis 5110]